MDTYKGVRDFYPEDERVQKYIFSVMEKVVESYGYEAYNASILEPTELYTNKTSEEIIKEQTYTFIDRGDRSVTLRPEMTPTVARMVAKKRRELGFPLRWYSIQNFFRYENPQKGRLREFWQLNVDLFGTPGIEADVEIIDIAYRILRAYGATEDMFVIKVADRNLLETAFDAANLTPLQKQTYRRLLDKKEKITAAEFKKQAGAISDTDPLTLIENRDTSILQALESVEKTVATLTERGVGNVVFDPSIVRGFDYYTGVVFEIFDVSGENTRSLFGGGRYDYLVEEYGGESVPAIGFGMGDVTARDFLATHQLLPENKSKAHVYLAPVTEHDAEHVNGVAAFLREKGVRVAVGMKHEKMNDHTKAAKKLHVPFFIAYGENEATTGTVKIKDLITKKEDELPLQDVARVILESEHA